MNEKDARLSFQARWADMDFNGHMRNTAYLDYAADSRMMYFKENGFPASDFGKFCIGPVIFRDTIQYFREVFMYGAFTVTLRLKGMSRDGSKFHMVNEFRKSDDTLVATVISEGCWLDLRERKVAVPPERLFQLMGKIEKTDDFVEIQANGNR